jgi:hypothetical protein
VRAYVRLGLCVAALGLLGCDAEARIRLLESVENLPTRGEDAGRIPPPRPPPDAGAESRDAAPMPPPQDSPSMDSLVLRYDFFGSGDVVPDLVGDNDARLYGGTTLNPERHFIRLDGVDDYVDIPNGVVSGLHSATFIVWLSWNGGPCWQRIFDFGVSDQGEDQAGDAVTSLFMTPRACGRETFTAMAEIGSMQYRVAAEEALPTRAALQVALVFDGDSQTFTLYRDSERVGEAPAPFALKQLTDTNNWLGRSQWDQDAYFFGAIGEFRIYSRVLTAEEIAQVRAEGFPTP